YSSGIPVCSSGSSMRELYSTLEARQKRRRGGIRNGDPDAVGRLSRVGRGGDRTHLRVQPERRLGWELDSYGLALPNPVSERRVGGSVPIPPPTGRRLR